MILRGSCVFGNYRLNEGIRRFGRQGWLPRASEATWYPCSWAQKVIGRSLGQCTGHQKGELKKKLEIGRFPYQYRYWPKPQYRYPLSSGQHVCESRDEYGYPLKPNYRYPVGKYVNFCAQSSNNLGAFWSFVTLFQRAVNRTFVHFSRLSPLLHFVSLPPSPPLFKRARKFWGFCLH